MCKVAVCTRSVANVDGGYLFCYSFVHIATLDASVVLYETRFVYEAQQTRTPFLCLKMDTDPGPDTLYICIMHRCIRARAHKLVLLKLDMNMSHLTLLMPKQHYQCFFLKACLLVL
jgi:hypothetical protein